MEHQQRINLRPTARGSAPFSTITPDLIGYDLQRLNAHEAAYMCRDEDTPEVRRIELAVFHMLMANELAAQQVLLMAERVRKSRYYRREVKQKLNIIEAEANKYRDTITDRVRSGEGNAMERLVQFADMNDNLEDVCGPFVERTRYAIQLSLGRVGVKDDALMAVAIMALKTCQAAVAVQKAEYSLNEQVAGGIIHHAQWASVASLTYKVYLFCHLLARETHTRVPEGFDPNEDLAINAGIAALCKKLGSVTVAAKAIREAVEQDVEPSELFGNPEQLEMGEAVGRKIQ